MGIYGCFTPLFLIPFHFYARVSSIVFDTSMKGVFLTDNIMLNAQCSIDETMLFHPNLQFCMHKIRSSFLMQ